MKLPDRILHLVALGLCLGSLLGIGPAFAQEMSLEIQEDLALSKGRFNDPFLSRYEAPYLSYGWIDYKNYREGIPIFKRYDSFGNYLAEGYEVFRMEEFRAAEGGQNGSTVWKNRFYQNWLRHLIVADDAYGGWSTRVTVGDAIQTTFSPLTLDMARFNGVRWDEASANNRFTFILSRFSDPLKLDLKNQLGPGGKRVEVLDGLYLMGGHWESRVGDFLVLGATFVNMHRFDSGRGYTTNTRKGLAPPFTEAKKLVLRFQDDSPEDGFGGAVVFDVRGTARIREEGIERFEEILPTKVDESDGVVEGLRHREASGAYADKNGYHLPVYIDYTFDVPDSTVGVTFAAVVANDYQILMRQDHDYHDPAKTRADSRSTGFIIVRRAEDNVVDLSNKTQVVFEQGMQTGQEMFGLDAEMNFQGFDVRGEVARSTNYLQFADEKGARSDYEDFAWYLTVNKKVAGINLGVEGFHIGPKYNSYAFKSGVRQNAETHPDFPSGEGVELELADIRTLGTPYYFNTVRQDPVSTDATEGGNKTFTPVYALVDDNDDMDQWPDDWVQDWDVTNREIKYLESDAGIYPFFDFDADGYPDNNRNRNQLADSDEPFLMYFTDPREFYFGDDFNNNFALDIWEDDDQPNYPYYKDEQGIHLVVQCQPLPGLDATLGRFDIEQIAGGGQSEMTYGRLKYQRSLGRGVWVRFDHESKSVRDGIANPYFDFKVELTSDGRLVPEQVFVADLLETRDSFVNRGLLHAKYRPGKFWNFNVKFRYELNDQQELVFDNGGMQPEDDLDFVGFLAKGDFTHHFGRLAAMPRFKMQYLRRERSSVGLPIKEEFMLAPILRLDYHLTNRSQIRFGIQGFPLVPDRRIDYRNHDNDADKQAMVLMYFNRSDYSGYKIGTEAGVEFQATDFDVRGASDESIVRYFVRMIAGVGTIR